MTVIGQEYSTPEAHLIQAYRSLQKNRRLIIRNFCKSVFRNLDVVRLSVGCDYVSFSGLQRRDEGFVACHDREHTIASRK